MQANINRPYTFDRVVRMVLGTIFFVGTLYIINSLKNVLGPFVIALFIAYLMDPLVGFIQNKLRVRYRGLAVLIAMTFVLSTITILMLYLIPAFIQEMNKMVMLIRQYLQTVSAGGILPTGIDATIRELIHETELISLLSIDNIAAAAKKVLPGFWNLFSGSIQVVVGLVGILVILLYTIFILLDFQKLGDFLFGLVPGKYHDLVVGVVDDLASAMNLYFRSQGLIALIVGVLLAVLVYPWPL